MAAHTTVLQVSYDGARFSGFARQPGEIETVQGALEKALSTALRREIVIVGAGRTDAGVHALAQVVTFEADSTEPEPTVLRRSLTALTPGGLVVTKVGRAAPGFSARFDATRREYRYRLASGPVPPLFLEPVTWWAKGEMDVAAMRQAAAYLVGEHDFRSFCVSESAEGKRTVRRLDQIVIESERALGEECLTVRVVGNAFLHSMVRVIVGSLVEVGAGRRHATWLRDALEARRRDAAGPTAPPQGLTLWRVEYPDGAIQFSDETGGSS